MNLQHDPSTNRHFKPSSYPLPFYLVGHRCLGHFLPAAGQVKYLITTIDYFIKWIEAKIVASITTWKVKQFLWKNVVCQFRVP